MRYFRRTEEPPAFGTAHRPGEIVPDTFFGDSQISFEGNEYWEEVIVTGKPKPKKIIKKVALFRNNYSTPLRGLIELVFSEEHSEAGGFERAAHSYHTRLTDWVEVTFIERTNK